MKTIFGREPTLWISVISALVIMLGTYGFHWINGNQAALIVVAINALAGAINAYTVRPISPTTFTYAIGSLIALGASYGLNLTPEQIAGLNGAVVPVLALLSRSQVSPVNTSLTRSTTPDEKAIAESGTGAPPSATVDN